AEPTMADLQEATRRFRKQMGFRSPAELEAWLGARGLSREEFMRLMADDARRHRLDEAIAPEIDDAVGDELYLTDAFTRLQSRADDKHAVLRNRGVEQPTLADAGISEPDLLAWYVKACGEEPDAEDRERQAKRLGYADLADLCRAALREYCYRAWKRS
ncbi:MAG: hypothetical protein ACREEV_12975, partial [Dongiaceae bacterium]